MTARFATQDEINNWNNHIIANPDGGNVFSSYEFAMQKETGDYKAHFVFVGNLAVTVLEKSVPLFGTLWYLPKGPGVTSSKELFSVLKPLETLAKNHGIFAIRIESELDRKQRPTLSRHSLVKSNPIVPNPSTITMDISDSLENIMTALPQKGRHAIKRAERDGATVEAVESSDEDCQIMYELLSKTAEGQFGIRSYEYFRTFWQRFELAGLGQLFFAYYKGKAVAGAYAMVYGKKSIYKDSTSIRKRTVYGASHLLQWHVIQWAKFRDALVYDLCESPPSEDINNPAHKHYSIGLFKTQFSKNVVDYIGYYNLAIDSIRYKIWINFLEKVAKRLHYYKHHDSYF